MPNISIATPYHVRLFAKIQLILVSVSALSAIGLTLKTGISWNATAHIVVHIAYVAEAIVWFSVFRKSNVDDSLVIGIHNLRYVLIFILLSATWVMRIADSSPWPSVVLFVAMLLGFLMGTMFLILPKRNFIHMGDIMRAWNLSGHRRYVAIEFAGITYFISIFEFIMAVFFWNAADPTNSYIALAGYQLAFLVISLVFAARPLSYSNSVGANCFLSYSRTDAECAKNIKSGLETYKLDCFHDIDAVRGGDEVYQTIGDGIEYSDFFIPILSEASLDSPWVQDEIKLALHYYRKNGAPIIIPVQNCDLEKISAWKPPGDDIGAKIRSKNMVKVAEGDDAKDQVAPLINALFAHSKGMVSD